VALWSFLFCLWAVLLLGWSFNWFKYRGNPGIGIHIFIGSTLFFNMLMALLWCLWWRYHDFLLKKGEWFEDLFDFADVISIGIFRALMILIAKGWCITTDTLPFNFKCGLTASMGFLLAVQILTGYFEDDNWLILFFLLTVVMYILMLCYIFYSIFENIKILETQTNNTPDKLRVFRQYRVVIIAFLVAEMFSIFFNTESFIIFGRACLDILFMSGVCWTFRLQEVNHVYYQPLVEGEMMRSPSVGVGMERSSSDMSELPLDSESEDESKHSEGHPNGSAVIQV